MLPSRLMYYCIILLFLALSWPTITESAASWRFQMYFTNTTSILVLYARYCGHHRLCDPDVVKFPVSTNLTRKYFNQCPKCRCDEKCQQFGDCCLDKLLQPIGRHDAKPVDIADGQGPVSNKSLTPDDTNTGTPQNTNSISQNLLDKLKTSTPNRLQGCSGKYAAVAACKYRQKHNIEDVLRCELRTNYTSEAITRVPVLSRTTNTSYINIFCAKCNDDYINTEPWKAEVECNEKVNFGMFSNLDDFFKKSNTCGKDIVFVPPVIPSDVRYCNDLFHLEFIDTECSSEYAAYGPKNMDIAWACENIHMPFTFKGRAYKNVFCYHCQVKNTSRDPFEPKTEDVQEKDVTTKTNAFVNTLVPNRTDRHLFETSTATPSSTISTSPITPTTTSFVNAKFSSVSVNTTSIPTHSSASSISTTEPNAAKNIRTSTQNIETNETTHMTNVLTTSATSQFYSSDTAENRSNDTNSDQDLEILTNSTAEVTNSTMDVNQSLTAVIESRTNQENKSSLEVNMNNTMFVMPALPSTTANKDQLNIIPTDGLLQSEQLITNIFGSNRSLDNFVKSLNITSNNITLDVNELLTALNLTKSSILDLQPPDSVKDSATTGKPLVSRSELVPEKVHFVTDSVTADKPLASESRSVPSEKRFVKRHMEVARAIDIPWEKPLLVPIVAPPAEIAFTKNRQTFVETPRLHLTQRPKIRFKPGVTDSCPARDNATTYQTEISWACDHFLQFGWNLPDTQYRNPFCCFCWLNEYECTREYKALGMDSDQEILRALGPFSSESYKVMFDFSSLFTGKSRLDGIPDACADGQLLDSHTKRCRDIHCSFGRHLVNDSCVPVLKTGSFLGYTTDITYITTVNFTLDNAEWKEVSEKIFQIYTGILSESILKSSIPRKKVKAFILSCNSKRADKFSSKFLPHIQHSCLDDICSPIAFINVKASFVLPQRADRDQADKVMMNLETIRLNISQGIADIELIPTTSEYSTIANVLETDSTMNERRLSHAEMASRTDRSEETTDCVRKMLLMKVKPSKLVQDQYKAMRFMKVHRLLMCPQIDLDSSEYIQVNESFIRVKHSSQLYSFMDYIERADGKVRICKAGYEAFVGNNETAVEEVAGIVEDIADILSWILTLLSLICLLATFVTYCLHVKLRTLPGKNNMFLAATLFCAQLFLFIGFQFKLTHVECAVFGVLTHYFWLAAFFSMNVCSFHMFRVFTGPILRSRYVQDARLIWYYINYILATPLFIVVAAVVTNLLMSDGADFGYGIGVCFLNGHRNVGLFFVLPIGCMIILNIFYFTNAACRIMHAPKLNRNRRDTRDFFMYMKLFSITGIAWIIQIVDSQFDIIYLRLISILLNASQGVFIFVAFVCNSRVFGMYKEFPSGSMSTFRSKISVRTTSDEVFGSSFTLARSSPKVTFKKSTPATTTEPSKSRNKLESEDTTCDSAFCSSEVLTDTETGSDVNTSNNDSKLPDIPQQNHSATL